MAVPIVLVVALGLALLLYAVWRRGRLAIAFVALTIAFALGWSLALAAIWTDYRDADGFVDCWPSCTALQSAAGTTFWFAPVTFAAAGLFAIALGTISARRRRGSRRRG